MLKHFIDFALNEKWKWYKKNAQYLGVNLFTGKETECISHAKFCSHVNVPFTPTQTQTLETIPLFNFDIGKPEQLPENFQTKTVDKTESLEKTACYDNAALEILLGDFNNEEGQFL